MNYIRTANFSTKFKCPFVLKYKHHETESYVGEVHNVILSFHDTLYDTWFLRSVLPHAFPDCSFIHSPWAYVVFERSTDRE